MPKLTDREVIVKSMAGDTRAFRKLVESHQGFVYSVAYRFVGNAMESEDITQETFIRLWKNLPTYRFEIMLTTWLYKIVTNLCIDYARSRHGQRRMKMTEIDGYILPAAPPSDSDYLEAEFKESIQRMTEQLTPKQKAVFLLRDVEELNVEEVCKILAMTSDQVKSNLYRARVKMAELITQNNEVAKPKEV